MPQSEIRASQISGLISKVQRSDYGKYLRSMRINRARGLTGAEVRFDFPVTALIGPNGGGKSTVLVAAACASGNQAGHVLSEEFDRRHLDGRLEHRV